MKEKKDKHEGDQREHGPRGNETKENKHTDVHTTAEATKGGNTEAKSEANDKAKSRKAVVEAVHQPKASIPHKFLELRAPSQLPRARPHLLLGEPITTEGLAGEARKEGDLEATAAVVHAWHDYALALLKHEMELYNLSTCRPEFSSMLKEVCLLKYFALASIDIVLLQGL